MANANKTFSKKDLKASTSGVNTKFYNNLKIIPKHQSKKGLNHQLSQATQLNVAGPNAGFGTF